MNISKTVLGIGTVTLLVIGLAIGYTLAPRTELVQGISSPGATGSTAKLYTITFSPSTGTSTSLLNTDGTDRAVTSTVAYCTGIGSSFSGFAGAGLANLTLKSSTSTSATVTAATLANINYMYNASVSTSSPWLSIASSTIGGGLGDVTRVWPTGTYINFEFNATNTASCTLGVSAIPL